MLHTIHIIIYYIYINYTDRQRPSTKKKKILTTVEFKNNTFRLQNRFINVEKEIRLSKFT